MVANALGPVALRAGFMSLDAALSTPGKTPAKLSSYAHHVVRQLERHFSFLLRYPCVGNVQSLAQLVVRRSRPRREARPLSTSVMGEMRRKWRRARERPGRPFVFVLYFALFRASHGFLSLRPLCLSCTMC